MAKPSWRSFSFDELAAATDNFGPENLIGKGGHAEVYKGFLSDGQLVAVKRLMKKQTEEERTGDFLSELGIIAHIDHPNAARLLGFGVDGGLHLVLQFSPHGSLASLLHGTEASLDWGVRFRVALGIAQGLNYLHRGCSRRIIHRDIKASNILLTEDYEPQISDFGLAKWLPDQWAHHIVFPIEGTFGYLAPEYFMHGIIDEKTDVFAFGVLLLELITGRRAVDSTRLSLVLWAKPHLDTINIKELVDPRLGDAYDVVEMKNMITTASICIHHLSPKRPDMVREEEEMHSWQNQLESGLQSWLQ
ncbi:non-specific serine/threonine protein kinase [Ranunculus cassubicifolius]